MTTRRHACRDFVARREVAPALLLGYAESCPEARVDPAHGLGS